MGLIITSDLLLLIGLVVARVVTEGDVTNTDVTVTTVTITYIYCSLSLSLLWLMFSILKRMCVRHEN